MLHPRGPPLIRAAWVPDASVDPFTPDPRGFVEEGGQRVGNRFWQEAHAAGIRDATENREALMSLAKPADRVDVFEGYPHSARSTDFLARRLSA
jgi:hypothetical protein